MGKSHGPRLATERPYALGVYYGATIWGRSVGRTVASASQWQVWRLYEIGSDLGVRCKVLVSQGGVTLSPRFVPL